MAVAESCFTDVPHDSVVKGIGIEIDYETFFKQYLAGGIARLPPAPLVARGWASAMVMCWRSWQAKGVVAAGHPLLVWDMVAGDGHFTALMLHALRQAWSEFAVSGWQFRYVACVAPGTDIEGWLIEAGLTDAPELMVTADSPWDGNDPVMQEDSYSPVVLVTYGYLRTMSCALRAVHYGQWLEGRVKFDSPQTFNYVWSPMDNEVSVPAVLRRRYQRTLTSASVQLPMVGLDMLQNLRKASDGHFLWLAADRGIIRESDIRLGALSPYSDDGAEGARACINFHAFALDASLNGEWVYQRQMAEYGVVTQAILGDATQAISESNAATVSRVLDGAHPDMAFRCIDLAHEWPTGTPAASYLALLHSTDYDAEVLRHVLEEWAEAPPVLANAEQMSWRQALAQVWSRCSRGSCDLPFRHRLGVLAARWGYLSLARSVFEADSNHFCLAFCEWLGGRSERAGSYLSRLPDDDCEANAFRQEWMARAHRWQTLDWYDSACACDGDLSIEPLGLEHAQAFHANYADPQIGVLTRLPELDTVDDVCAWMAMQEQDPRRATYAVMHVDVGFIGVVSCHSWRDAGYFYFWIGNEYQGNGYGRRAARLLFRQAGSQGMRWLFTSAYQENARSIEALENVGFRRLGVSAVPPDEDLVFFVHGPDEELASHARLATVLAELNSSIALKDERQ